MKKRKNIIIVAVVVTLVFVVVALAMLFSGEYEERMQEQGIENNITKALGYIEKDIIATNEYYGLDMENFEVNLDNYVAYSMDYNAELPCENGDGLSKLDGLSGTVTTALLFGYPTFTPEEMGVESEEEARMATQFAVWRLAQADGIDESKSLEYIFDMDNLKAKVGCEESLERIKVAAQGLVDIALKAPYYANPTLNIDNEDSKIRLKDEHIIVGPYIVNASGYNVEKVDVILIDAPESAMVCDENGNSKTEFANLDKVYIRLDKNVSEVTFTLRLDTVGTHTAGVVYGTGVIDDNKQNFCILETFGDELDAIMDISIPKIELGISEDVRGYLKVISVDETKEKLLEGITYEILNEDGIVIETLISDANGEIISQELPGGKYYFREVSGPNDIHIDSTKYEFSITDDGVTEVYTLLNYYARGKVSFFIKDENDKPVEGVEIHILDADHNVIDIVYSDTSGNAISKYLLIGKYFYQQISVPENNVVDSLEYEFALTESMEILECWIEIESR